MIDIKCRLLLVISSMSRVYGGGLATHSACLWPRVLCPMSHQGPKEKDG